MGGLSSLVPGGPMEPVTGPLQRANPVSGNSVLSSAVDNLYSDAAILNPQDGFAQNFLANTPSAAEIAALKAQAYNAQKTTQDLQQKYLQYLESQSGPQRESQLNWQALGRMGAAMMQPANDAQPGGQTQWSRGAQTYADARGENQKLLDNAAQELAKTQYGFGKENADSAMSNYKMAEEIRRANMKEAGDLYEKLLTRQNTSRFEYTDSTGRRWLGDKQDPTFKRLLADSNGLTPEQNTQLGQYYIHLNEVVPDSPDKQAIVTAKYSEKLNELRMSNQSSPLSAVATQPSFISSSGNPAEVAQAVLDSDSPAVTPEDKAAAKAFLEAQKGGEKGPGVPNDSPFSADDLAGYNPAATNNPSKMDTEAWKLRLERSSKQAQAELEAASTNLQQSDAMLESSRAALATQAPTGLLQTYKNWLGSLLGFAGVQGPIVDEAMKGTTFETLVNGAVQVLQNAAKGVQTEGDAQRFRQSLVNIKNSAEANQHILKYMEAMQLKRQLEVEYRYLYSANNVDPAGAGYKWSQLSKNIPLIQTTPNGPVYFSEFMTDYMNSVDGATKASAMKAWRQLKGK